MIAQKIHPSIGQSIHLLKTVANHARASRTDFLLIKSGREPIHGSKPESIEKEHAETTIVLQDSLEAVSRLLRMADFLLSYHRFCNPHPDSTWMETYLRQLIDCPYEGSTEYLVDPRPKIPVPLSHISEILRRFNLT